MNNDSKNAVELIEQRIRSCELDVESLTKEFDEKEYTKEATTIACLIHNKRGILEGLRMSLKIVESGGAST